MRANGGVAVRYQRGAEAVVGGVERGKRLAELRKAQFAEKLHGGVVAAHNANACEAREYATIGANAGRFKALAQALRRVKLQ